MKHIFYPLLILIPCIALGQDTRGISLDSCIHLALRNNHSIRQAASLFTIADAELRSAKLAATPNVSFQGLAVYGAQPMLPAIPGLWPVPLRNSYVGAIHVGQTIYAGGRLKNAADASRIKAELSELGFGFSLDSVMMSITATYWQIVAIQGMEDAIASQKKLLEKVSKQQRDLQRAGMSSDNDRLRIELQLDRIGLEAMKLDNERQVALYSLCTTMGLDYSRDLLLRDTLAELDFPPLLPDTSLKCNRRLSICQKGMELSRLATRIEIGRMRPTLSAGLTTANIGMLAQGSRSRTLGLGSLSVTVPISAWWASGRFAKVKASELSSISEAGHEILSRQLRMAIVRGWQKWLEARAEVSLSRKMVIQSAENLRTVDDAFGSGLIGTSEVLEAQALLRQAEGQVATSLAALATRRAEYLFLLQN